MNIDYNYIDIVPQFIVLHRYLGQPVYTINFNIEEIEEHDQIDGRKYRYNTVTLPAGQYDRSTVISAVIRQRYSDDDMQAIINNYLLDQEDEDIVAEFNEMQEYRKFAKALADQFLQEIA